MGKRKIKHEVKVKVLCGVETSAGTGNQAR